MQKKVVRHSAIYFPDETKMTFLKNYKGRKSYLLLTILQPFFFSVKSQDKFFEVSRKKVSFFLSFDDFLMRTRNFMEIGDAKIQCQSFLFSRIFDDSSFCTKFEYVLAS